jgi:Family of unknown function (DUF6350)
VRGGLLAFLAAQHGGVRIDGVGIGFIPLGLTWFAVYLCRRSGQVLWALPAVVRDVGRRRVLELTAVQTVSYAVTTTLVSFYAVVGRSSASALTVALGSVAVGLVGFGSVASTMTPVGAQYWRSRPESVQVAAKAGAAATCTFVAGGALLALGSTVLHIGRFLDLTRGMGRGLSGLPVAVGDTLAVPNAVVAATSYLAGPGFAVGHHATYAPFGGHGGLVPAFPVLAGLPDGEHASLTVLALLAVTVLGAGLGAGVIVARETAGWRWPVALGTAAGSGACAAVVLGALTALAGGSLGSRRLETVGASPLQVGLAVLLEVALVSMASVGVRRLFAHHAANRAANQEGPAQEGPAQEGPAQEGPAQAELAQVGLAQAELAQAGTAVADVEDTDTAPSADINASPVTAATHAARQVLAGAMRRSIFTRARAARSGRLVGAEKTGVVEDARAENTAAQAENTEVEGTATDGEGKREAS